MAVIHSNYSSHSMNNLYDQLIINANNQRRIIIRTSEAHFCHIKCLIILYMEKSNYKQDLWVALAISRDFDSLTSMGVITKGS